MTDRGKPALGKLEPGQDVVVIRSPNSSRHRKPEDCRIPAKVIKVARVWVELERSGLAQSQLGHRTWRMRLDTQDEGTQFSGSNDRFLTVEQNAWEETRDWARGVLRDNGIDLRGGSPWIGREAELVDLIVGARHASCGHLCVEGSNCAGEEK